MSGVGVCEQMGCSSSNRNKGKNDKEIDRESEDMCACGIDPTPKKKNGRICWFRFSRFY